MNANFNKDLSNIGKEIYTFIHQELNNEEYPVRGEDDSLNIANPKNYLPTEFE
jgi:hypothetical protein